MLNVPANYLNFPHRCQPMQKTLVFTLFEKLHPMSTRNRRHHVKNRKFKAILIFSKAILIIYKSFVH